MSLYIYCKHLLCFSTDTDLPKYLKRTGDVFGVRSHISNFRFLKQNEETPLCLWKSVKNVNYTAVVLGIVLNNDLYYILYKLLVCFSLIINQKP